MKRFIILSVTLAAGFCLTSSDSYHLEASYHYMFNRFVGVGGAFGFWKVYFEEGYVLKSPALKIRSVDIGLYAEPGVMLNVPYTRVAIRRYSRWPDYDYEYTSTNRGQNSVQ